MHAARTFRVDAPFWRNRLNGIAERYWAYYAPAVCLRQARGSDSAPRSLVMGRQ